MRVKSLLVSALLLTGLSQAQPLRPPAYPLITHDPYFSVWSTTDKLTGSPTCHWTGKPQSLEGLVRVDGKPYQFLGATPIIYQPILPSGESKPYPAKYTFSTPHSNWKEPNFNTTGWLSGPGPFGDTPDAKTRWQNRDTHKNGIYFRREFNYDGKADPAKLMLSLYHDDEVVIYLNGIRILTRSGYLNEYVYLSLSVMGQKALRPGKNVLAVHCISPYAGSFIDVGLVNPVVSTPMTPAIQTSVTVSATQTEYAFRAGPVALTVNFLSPLLLDELDVVARPVTYLTFTAKSADGKPHTVQFYVGACGTLATHSADQDVVVDAGATTGVSWLNIGTQQQPLLTRKGDNVRIDWGYAYLAVPQSTKAQLTAGSLSALKTRFASQGTLPPGKTALGAARDFGLAVCISAGSVGTSPVQKHLMLAYDDLYSVQYFGKNLRPWWRRTEKMTMPALLQTAETDYTRLKQKSSAFDARLYTTAQQAGGKQYADLCALAYRQSIAAHKMVAGPKGELFFLSKENFSNGSIGTVDITYPSAPLFLLYNTALLKGMMEPIFQYSESGKWTKPFAAHDVGTYPIANGQTYEEDMPVEECGNMLLLAGAITRAEGNANYAKQHWKVLTTWATYLRKNGFDPANQLCTDDFAGHIARNANLSVKAILAIAAYGQMAAKLGDPTTAATYLKTARNMAIQWQQLAADKGHYDLTFGNPDNTWSQKYNLVWDKLLDMKVFPKTVPQTEIAYYLTRQKPYGLPLDSRKTYTKSDWIIWTATLADSNKEFQAFIAPVWKFVNETPSRVPLTDWHETTDAKQVGFQARSVVGGYYIKLLEAQLAARN